MNRRGLLLLLISGCVSGCATMSDDFVDQPPASSYAVVTPRLTPEQVYEAGALDLVRGDSEGARRKWDLCVEMAPADSPARLDCMVALEKMAIAPSQAR